MIEATSADDGIEHAGDPLGEDAHVAKKGRTAQWKEITIGSIPVLLNKSSRMYRCPIPGCVHESEQQRSVTVHVAWHRKQQNNQNPPSQDFLQFGSQAELSDSEEDII